VAAAATPSCGREEVTKRLELDAEKGSFLTRSERGGKRFDMIPGQHGARCEP
jgi:hypothetical protein